MAGQKVIVSVLADTKKFSRAMKNLGNETGLTKLGSGFKTAAKAAAAFTAAGVTAFAVLSKAVVGAYADYEQNVGGIETMFKDSSGKMLKYAQDAYKTSGLSANDYMAQATSFSAALLQSLGGDTSKAADYANKAMIDMSDNANKFGSNIGDIQNAYQGFAKQNYTMLDNLKLGYGGTKSEMQRLLDDASKLPAAMGREFDLENYSDIVEAIHLVQDEMGIMGTTAEEAEATISGSIGMTKAAWDNLLVGLGSKDADLQSLIGDVTSSAKSVVTNIAPVVGNIITNLAEMYPPLGKVIETAKKVSDWFLQVFWPALQRVFSSLRDTIGNAVTRIRFALDQAGASASGLGASIGTVLVKALETAGRVIGTVIEVAAKIVAWMIQWKDILVPLAAGIATAVVAVTALSKAIKIGQAVMAVFNVVMAANPIGIVVVAIAALVAGLVVFFTKTATGKKIIAAVWSAMQKAITTAVNAIKKAVNWFTQLPGKLATWFGNAKDKAIAKFVALVTWVKGLPQRLIVALATLGVRLATSARDGVNRFKDKAVERFLSARDWVKNIPVRFVSALASLGSKLSGSARDSVNRFKDKMVERFLSARDWVRNLPTKLLSALGNTGNLLKSAGRNIISGLWTGLLDKWQSVKNWVSGLGSWIADHKGPASYDKRLLQPAGRWIMQGLQKGLTDEINALKGTLDTVTTTVADTVMPALAVPTITPSGTSSTVRAVAPATINVYALTDGPDVGRRVESALKKWQDVNGR